MTTGEQKWLTVSQGKKTTMSTVEKTQTREKHFEREKRFAITHKFKLERAQGECLGTGSRRRTRQAAKSHGELQISLDPWVSEWGNPSKGMLRERILNT